MDTKNVVICTQKHHINGHAHETGVDGPAAGEDPDFACWKNAAPHKAHQALPEGRGKNCRFKL